MNRSWSVSDVPGWKMDDETPAVPADGPEITADAGIGAVAGSGTLEICGEPAEMAMAGAGALGRAAAVTGIAS
jgi:hypothetical protein